MSFKVLSRMPPKPTDLRMKSPAAVVALAVSMAFLVPPNWEFCSPSVSKTMMRRLTLGREFGSVPLVPSITCSPISSPALMCVQPFGLAIESITCISASASNESPLTPPTERTLASVENSTRPMAVDVGPITNWRTTLFANSLSCEW